jgi:hypothetical protein
MSPDNHSKATERRSGIDRRQFSYALHIPERRVRDERRRRWRKPSKRLQEALPVTEMSLPDKSQLIV